MQAQSLVEFCAAIGVSRVRVVAAESPRRYRLVTDVEAGRLKEMDGVAVDRLVEAFGRAVTMTIGFPDLLPLVNVDRGEVAGLEGGLAEISSFDDSLELRLEMRLDKELMLSQLGVDEAGQHGVVYLFHENLVGFLRSPLPVLDTQLFGSPDQPTVVVVLDKVVRYCGSLLAITDPDGVVQAQQRLGSVREALPEMVAKYRQTASEELHWLGFELRHLTPAHLECERVGGVADPLEGVLSDKLRQLVVLYTANLSVYGGEALSAVYSSSGHIVEMSLSRSVEQGPLDMTLFRWIYQGIDTDRLAVFQDVVVGELRDRDPETNYRTFCSRLGELCMHARYQYGALLAGWIEREREAERYVRSVAAEVSDRLASVTKGVTETLLATMGLVVVTLLASVVQQKMQAIVFQIALWSYAGYLLLFQGGYRLGSSWHSYHLLSKETEEQFGVYEAALGRERIETMVPPLQRRRSQFRAWFWGTAGLYLGVAVTLILLGLYLPGWFPGAGLLSPSPSASPVSAP